MIAFLQKLLDNEIVQGIIVVVFFGIIAKLLPILGNLLKNLYKKWITHKINKCVKKAEKKFSDPKSGDKKKSYVLSQTQKYNDRLTKMNTNIDTVIENCVQILNTKNATMKESLQANVTDLANTTAESLKATVTEAVQTKITETLTK